MSNRGVSFLHRLTAWLTLWMFVFTTLAPSHGALSQARERFGRVQSVTHSSGKAVVFHRNGAGRVERITDPAGAELLKVGLPLLVAVATLPIPLLIILRTDYRGRKYST